MLAGLESEERLTLAERKRKPWYISPTCTPLARKVLENEERRYAAAHRRSGLGRKKIHARNEGNQLWAALGDDARGCSATHARERREAGIL